MLIRAKWIAGLATLALSGASGAVALAGRVPSFRHSGLEGEYTVRLHVPTHRVHVPPLAHIPIRAEGEAPNLVHLTVFVSASNRLGCDRTAAQMTRESRRQERVIIDEKVHGHFAARGTYVTLRTGTHHVCAYLYEVPRDTLARNHREVSFEVQ